MEKLKLKYNELYSMGSYEALNNQAKNKEIILADLEKHLQEKYGELINEVNEDKDSYVEVFHAHDWSWVKYKIWSTEELVSKVEAVNKSHK